MRIPIRKSYHAARGRPPRCTIGIVVALVGFVVFPIAGSVDNSDPNGAVQRLSEPTQHSQLLDAAVEQIESDRVYPGPNAAPGVSGSSRGDPGPSHVSRNLSEPPDGYSYVTFAGKMPTRFDNEVESSTGPSAPRPDWVDSTESVAALAHQAARAGRMWTFGWLLLAPGESPRDVARRLGPLGVEVLATAGRLLRTRLPADATSLREIAATAGIDGLGATPAALKLAPWFAQKSLSVPDERHAVFVTLMADDTDGQWRRELERLGAVVGRYDDAVRIYTATADHTTLMRLGLADFVLAVEPVGIVTAAHDTAAPAMGVDALRLHTGSPGEFSGVGGTSVAVGVMDTGLNIRHADIATNRDSICGRNFVWLFPPHEDEDLWVDRNGHGTHVTATIVGNGFARAKFAGMAPSVRRLRFAKVLSRLGVGTNDSVLQGMDFLAETSPCNGSATAIPLVVNMSFNQSSSHFEGRGTAARKLDATVWDTRQLYVVAQDNEGTTGFSNYASAKNSLAVGAVFDGGEIAPFSSHGPTADGRLAPLVVATGVGVCSAKGDGSPAGYQCRRGTSMASPTVAGVSALLMDAVPDYQLQPALVRSRLMASAIRPDAWLEDPAAFPPTNTNGPGFLQSRYGLGRVSARTSILDKDHADGWFGGGATAEVAGGEYAYHDIEVPDGATRLDIVTTWDEPPADTVGPPVLNNLDLWVDQGADCAGGP
ncbi:MAG: S8 family serine peptidase [Gammaproteobacteria bacterium]|nr:S8 family serine peptidase [Gammaproteobacteria bacterium]